jgi:hypothetical protein
MTPGQICLEGFWDLDIELRKNGAGEEYIMVFSGMKRTRYKI